MYRILKLLHQKRTVELGTTLQLKLIFSHLEFGHFLVAERHDQELLYHRTSQPTEK